MSDETPDIGNGGAEDDGRDERLAAWLDVAPLDEVTRRRLVRTAVAAAPSPARSRPRFGIVASVAAAVVAAIVVAGVALRDGSGDPPTAAPKATTGQDRERTAQTTTAPGAPSEDAATPPPLATTTALPDLGDVSDEAALRTGVNGLSSRELATVPVVPCPELLAELDDLVAVAQGVDHGARVLVLTGTEDGRRVAVSLVTEPCEVREKVLL